MDFYTCANCQAVVPVGNKIVHSARCRTVVPAVATVAPTLASTSPANPHDEFSRTSESVPITETASEYADASAVPVIDIDDSLDDIQVLSDSFVADDATPAANGGFWECESCTYRNISGIDKCAVCDVRRAAKNLNTVNDSGVWTCSACTLVNNKALTRCGACDEPRFHGRVVTDEDPVRDADPTVRTRLVDDEDYFVQESDPTIEIDEDPIAAFERERQRLIENAMLLGGRLGGAGVAALFGATAGGIGAQFISSAARPSGSATNYSTNGGRSGTGRAGSRNSSGDRSRDSPFANLSVGSSPSFANDLMQMIAQHQMAMGGRGLNLNFGPAGVQFGDAMNIDGMSYQALLERFSQPVRATDEETLQALPTHTYTGSSCPSSGEFVDLSSDDATIDDSTTTATSPPSEAPQCAVCMCEYEHGDCIKTLPCLHQFHAECIDRWLRSSVLCPVCKHSLR